ncbi:MAG: proteasome ATPase, partial [Actinomycetota bacterium]
MSEAIGEVVHLKELLDDGVRAVVVSRGDDNRVCELADSMRGAILRNGDLLRMDPKTSLLLEKLSQP